MKVTDKYILFWGGKLSKFSNFCPCIINYEGNIFHSSEQLYMYFKAKTFCDADSVRAICEAESPSIAKEFGQQIKNYDDDIWAAEREKYMDIVLYKKFTQNEEMYSELMREEYRDKHFVEASPEDTIWGIGLHFDDPNADDEANWLGQNLLGKCLDRVRERLNREQPRI